MPDSIEITKVVHRVEITAPGPQGAAGVGVPAGGTLGQVLKKASGDDYDTEWAGETGGGGGVTDHGLLTGLADDDHAQYALADGSRGAFAASVHTHAAADITDFAAAADARIAAADLGDLADVTITTVAAGELLAWDGAAWINRTLAEAGVAAASHTHTLADITDAGTAAAADTGDFAAAVHTHAASQVTDFAEAVDDRVAALLVAGSNITITYDDGANTLTVAAAGGGGPAALDDLTDVTITAAASGEFLRYNGSAWVDAAIDAGDLPSHAHAAADITDFAAAADARIAAASIDDLADVTITTVAAGELLAWDGAAWINRTLAEAGVAAAAHTHAAADIVSGTFDDARIAASNVTQHAGSIDHGSIAGLADDDHTQYIALAPATSARNVITAGGIAVSGLEIRRGTGGSAGAVYLFHLASNSGATTFFGVYHDVSGVGSIHCALPLECLNQQPLRLFELTANGSSYVGFRAAASLAGSQVWTLPAADGAAGEAMVSDGSGTLAFKAMRLPDAGAVFDGGGSQPTSGTKALRPVEVASTIVSASIVGDASGSCTVTCRKYTPAAGALGSATTLGTIALSAAQHNRDTVLSGWTTALAAGDVVEFEIGGTISTVTRVAVILERRAS